MDTTQNTKKAVFLGTLTAGGTRYRFENGRLMILEGGKARKVVRQVTQISFNGPSARKERRPVFTITERTVFELKGRGVVLAEITLGIDLKTQMLGMTNLRPVISGDLKKIDKRLFIQDGPFGLKEQMIQC